MSAIIFILTSIIIVTTFLLLYCFVLKCASISKIIQNRVFIHTGGRGCEMENCYLPGNFK